MSRLFFAVLALLVVSAGAPGAAIAATHTPTAEASIDDVPDLLDQEPWNATEADRVYAGVQSGDLSRLSDDEADRLLRRLLDRAGRETVPAGVIEATADRVGQDRSATIASEVSRDLPDRQANRLRDFLDLSGLQLLDGSTATATITPTGASGENEVTSNETIQLTRRIDITRWRFVGGEFVVTLNAELPGTVTLTDSMAVVRKLRGGTGQQAAKIPRRTFTLDAGVNTIRFDGTRADGEAAVSIASGDRLVLLRTGAIDSPGEPVERRTAEWMIGAVAVATVLSVGIVVVRRQREEDEEVTKIV